MQNVRHASRSVNQKFSGNNPTRKPAQIVGRAFRCQQWKLAPAAGTGRRDYVATRQKRCAQLVYVLMRYSRAGDGRDIFAAMDTRNGILQSLIELNAGLPGHERLRWSRRSAYVYLKRLRDAKIERIDLRQPYHGRARRRVLDATALLAAPPQVCTGPPPRSAHHTSKTYSTKNQNLCDTDSPTAPNAVRPCAQNQNSTPKPHERPALFVPRELLKRFCESFRYPLVEGNGRLGWIVKRIESRKVGEAVRNVWRYICAANASIDARSDDPAQLDWLFEIYSFADMFHLDLYDPYFDPID